MLSHYIFAFIVGWCGSEWPIRFPIPRGGGGGVEPGDWPPNCPMCGQVIGGIAAVVLVAALGSSIESTGLFGLVTMSFFAGKFGSSFLGGMRKLMTGS